VFVMRLLCISSCRDRLSAQHNSIWRNPDRLGDVVCRDSRLTLSEFPAFVFCAFFADNKSLRAVECIPTLIAPLVTRTLPGRDLASWPTDSLPTGRGLCGFRLLQFVKEQI